MNCEDFDFYTKVDMNLSAYLDTSCVPVNYSSQRTSDYFTGYSKLTINKSGSSCGILCQYDDNTGSNFVRSTLVCGENTLDPNKYYRISSLTSNNIPTRSVLTSCTPYSPLENIKYKLNSTDSSDLYNDLSVMVPFLIILIIFSFSFLVLKRIIKSASKGDVNL